MTAGASSWLHARAAGARAPRRGWLPLLLLVLVCCTRQPADALATLQLALGAVERDFAAQRHSWQTAEIGARFAIGDGLRTRAASSALLELAGGDQLSLDPDTSIRFASTPPEAGSLNLELVLGSVSVQAARELAIQTPAGPARVAPGTRVVLSGSQDALRFFVQVGQAVFAGDEVLAAGEAVNIDASGVSKPAPAPAQPPAAAPESAPAPAAAREARLISAEISGRRASIRTGQGWAPLAEGSAKLSPGSELSLERDTSIVLEHLNQRAVLREGRYVVAPRADVLVSAASGSLSAGSAGRVRIAVPGGTIEVAPQGQAGVRVERERTQVEVQARQVSLETAAGSQRLGPHERAVLHAGGKLSVEGRSLDYADVELNAGESVVLHDPSPPTAVRFTFAGACPELGLLQLFQGGKAQAYAAGRELAALAIKTGQHRYELRCAGSAAVVARGNIAVQRDSGTRRMVGPQPATTLQADGRDYTVLYQNRLPDITLLWRDAPAGQGTRLVHEFEGKSTTIEVEGSRHVFASGSLVEGRHVLHFVGGGKLSRRTTVNVAFDNAAPKAAIDTPVAVTAPPGAELTVSGIALPGWDVSIEGQPAKRDAQGRFSLPVAWPRERRALAIRLGHPERGTHVYLRRRAP